MKNIVEIKKVTQKYKGAKEESLKEVSLCVNKGETLLLCGASGSGKTSVIRLINGLIPHFYQGGVTGSVTVKEYDVSKTELYELAGVVGTVFQNPRSQFFSIDTDGEIVFGPENIGLDPSEIKNRKETVINEMQLGGLLGRSLFELSGGEKQRIACASVAALLPEIILLDEPSSNLDFEAIDHLKRIVTEWKKQGKTIIISEHRLWYLRDIADRVIYMENGRIKNEWRGSDFWSLDEENIKGLMLRPTSVKEHFTELFNGEYLKKEENLPDFSSGITFKDFYFSYKRKPYVLYKKKFTLKDGESLNMCVPKLTLPKGKVIGVIGRNGTGKSTFLRCLCGLEKECTGVIEADGKEYKGRHRIGFSYMVMQDVNHQLFTNSVEAEVMLSMDEKNEEKCLEILEYLGLKEYRDTHPMALSGGQKQRVAIASAIAKGAKLLLFDEPTSGLDYTHMEKVGSLLKKLADDGSTILVSTHDPELIDGYCDYELYIENGRVQFLREI